MCKYLTIILTFVLIIAGCGGPDDEQIERADILFERAVQYAERGRYDEAAAAFENLVAVDSELGRTGHVALHERYLGIIAQNTGKFEDARYWYNRAIASSRRAADHTGILDGMNRLASLSTIMGDQRGVYEHIHNTLTYTQFFNYPYGEAETLIQLGSFETERGRIDIAHRHFTRAVQIAIGLDEPELRFRTHIALGKSYINQGHLNEAYEQIREAENYFDAVELSEQIEYELVSGKLYETAGRYTEAQSLYESAWNTYREQPRNNTNFLRLIESLANTYLVHGRYRDALSYYNMLADLTRNYDRQLMHGYALLGKSDSFLKFGIVVDNNDYLEQALQIAREAEAHFGHIHYFTGQAYAVFQQARLVSLLGRSDEAIQLYSNALDYLTETLTPESVLPSQKRFEQRNNLSEPHSAITQFLVNELIQSDRYADAFRYTERNRQKVLNEKVLRIGLASSDTQGASYADSLTQLYQKLRGLEYARLSTFEHHMDLGGQRDTLRAMTTTTRETIEILQDYVSESLRNSQRLFDKNIPSLNTYQNAVPVGRTLVSYYPTQTHLHIFILNRGLFQVRSHEIPYEVLQARINSYQKIISSSLLYDPDDYSLDRSMQQEYIEHARWIYNTFIDPVLGVVGNTQHLICVMPPLIHDLPLHALTHLQSRTAYLVNNIRFSYLPSATVLTFQLQPPRTVSSIAAIGNPGGNDWDIDYEIRDIRGIYNSARIHLESNASIDRLRAEQGDILHLAAEFFYQPSYPEHSYFRLTREGSIAVREFGLEHLTGLFPFSNVILYNTGEVVEGLSIVHPYIMFLNGSRSIVVNHWKREPRSAKWFNENIYSNLSINHSMIEAFHDAQRTLISTPEYAHPHFWASFFLYSP